MILQKLRDKKLINCPDFLPDNTTFLTIHGSQAYGCNTNDSDMDIYGFCIPPKGIAFPHLSGKIFGLDKDFETFQQWQQHHIIDKDALGGKGREYDFQVFGIIKYFALLADNNPNIIDSLFTPNNCILHSTPVGTLVRDNRKMFLHKGAFYRFRGYAFSQEKKIKTKEFTSNPKRVESIKKYGYDVKFGYHLLRLLEECHQILETGDIDLQRDSELLKSVRRGEWTEQQIHDYFASKERSLEELYHKSTLPYGPDMDKIRSLLMTCFEMHYGSIDNCIVEIGKEARILQEIKKLVGSI